MSDLIQLQLGARPWLPSLGVELVEELDRYERPTVGVLRQHDGCLYLFECLEGIVHDVNVWAYASISEEEAQRLRDARGEQLDALVEQVLASRRLMIGVAINDEISFGVSLEGGRRGAGPLASVAIEAIKDGLDRERSAMGGLDRAAV